MSVRVFHDQPNQRALAVLIVTCCADCDSTRLADVEVGKAGSNWEMYEGLSGR